jgi:hypothetical protein
MSATYKFTGLFGDKVAREFTGTLDEVTAMIGMGIDPMKESKMMDDLHTFGIGEMVEGDETPEEVAKLLGALGLPAVITTRIELVSAE